MKFCQLVLLLNFLFSLNLLAESAYEVRLRTLTPTEAARVLYSDMMNFKGEASFHEVGFSPIEPKTKYRIWFEALESLKTGKEFNREFLIKHSFVLGDVLQVAKDFMRTKGRGNTYTDEMMLTINNGLKRGV